MTGLSYLASICLVVLMSFASMGASASSGENPFFDYQQLRPSPQQVAYFNHGQSLEVVAGKAYELRVTPALAEDAAYIARRFEKVAGVKVTVVVDASLASKADHAALLRADENWAGPAIAPPRAAKAAGYGLLIEASGALVVANEQVGAFHGLQTLVQAFALAREDGQMLPAALITDWPDVANRSMLLVVNRLRGNDDLTYLKSVLDTLSALKFNSVFFEFDSALHGPKFAYPKQVPNPLDDAKIAELCDYARSLHLEVNLAFQFGAHCTWLLSEPAYEHLGETDKSKFAWDNTNWSPANEQLWPVVEDLVKHQIAICKPKRVHIAHDEMEFGQFNTSESSKAAGLSNEELIAMSIKRLRDMIPSDIKVMVWFDLFMPDGMKKSHRVGFVKSDRMMALTPRDIEINLWLYGGGVDHVEATSHMKRHDRKFWTATFEAPGVERVCYFTKTLGAEGVLGTHWYEIDSKWNRPRGISAKAIHAMVALGQYAWSSAPVPNLFEQDTVRLFRLMADGPAITRSLGQAEVVDLTRVANGDQEAIRSEARWVGQLVDALRSGKGDATAGLVRTIPGGGVLLAGSETDPATLPRKVTIPVGKTVGAVTFYHTAGLAEPAAGIDAWNKALNLPRLGTYTLVFSDGQKETTQVLSLDYRWNIQDWNSLYGSYASRLAWSLTGSDGVRMQVQQMQWQASEEAGRRLERIEFTSDLRNGMNPYLLLITTHAPRSDDADKAAQAGDIKVIWADDFEYKTQRELQQAWSGINRKFAAPEMRVGGSASGEKSLRWELPAVNWKARDDLGFQRERIDFTAGNELIFKIRTLGGSEEEMRGFTCALYLGNAKENYWYRYVVTLPAKGKWEEVRLPLAARFTEGKVPPKNGMANLDTFMISVWHKNQTPVSILIDDMRVIHSENRQLYRKVR